MAYIILADRPIFRGNREIISHLRQRRHRVDVTDDGSQALSLVLSDPPDVVAMSFSLSNLDGLELATEVRRLCPPDKPQLLLITLMKEDGEPAIDWRFPDFANFILQPYNPWQLVVSIEQLIYRSVTFKQTG